MDAINVHLHLSHVLIFIYRRNIQTPSISYFSHNMIPLIAVPGIHAPHLQGCQSALFLCGIIFYSL